MSEPIRVVSVSLGSSHRDKTVEAEFLGRRVIVERRGTDGDFAAARQLIADLDGKVSAIGLGGIDLYLVAGTRRWVVKDALRLAQMARTTPVVDGSGLKNTLERQTVRYLRDKGLIVPTDGSDRLPRCLMVSAVDRFGMAEAFAEMPAECVYGDLIFALKIPLAIRRLSTIRLVARTLLPVLCRLPFTILYPTGDSQKQHHGQGEKWFRWADVIGGDYHFIGTNLPPATAADPRPLAGKLMITNTTTDEDVTRLRELGLARLVTTTPRLQGRSFGTNVMEGVLVALSGKRPEELGEADYLDLLTRLDWEPQVDQLQEA
jgi:hypothetical protein